MIDLIKLVMAKPLQGIVASLCVVTLVLYIGLNEMKVAMAISKEQQRMDEKVTEIVFMNHEALIRVDENLKTLTIQIERFRNENQVKPTIQH